MTTGEFSWVLEINLFQAYYVFHEVEKLHILVALFADEKKQYKVITKTSSGFQFIVAIDLSSKFVAELKIWTMPTPEQQMKWNENEMKRHLLLG